MKRRRTSSRRSKKAMGSRDGRRGAGSEADFRRDDEAGRGQDPRAGAGDGRLTGRQARADRRQPALRLPGPPAAAGGRPGLRPAALRGKGGCAGEDRGHGRVPRGEGERGGRRRAGDDAPLRGALEPGGTPLRKAGAVPRDAAGTDGRLRPEADRLRRGAHEGPESVKRKLPVKVTSTAEAEEAAYLACIPADGDTYYADNLFGYCCRCGTKVQFRPHAPVKPKRLCTKCGLEETVK